MKQNSSKHQRKPTPVQPALQVTPLLVVCAALILIALMFGGGGVRYGLANLIVQIAALGVLAFYRNEFFAFWQRAPIALRVLVGLSIALPALQLIPLPQSVWTALPGRNLAADAREAVGAMGWASASLDQARTMVALSGLIVPLTVLTVGWSLDRGQIYALGWVVVVWGVINLLLGSAQVLNPETVTSLYPENPMPGVLFGTFANRNSTGIFLVAALSFACLLPSILSHPLAKPGRIVICALLILAILLTRSRTALALATLPLLLVGVKFAFERFAAKQNDNSSNKAGVMIGVSAALLVAVIAGLLAFAPGRIGDTLDRFDQDGDPRSYIWEDALYASERYWPAGAGMGTFDEVFQVDESLENMTLRRAGRAHNDYLEVAIEAGLAGLVLIAAWLIVWAWLTWRAKASSERWVAWSGAVILLAVALQSITDYPLRNQSMLAIAALALLMLARCGAPLCDEKEGE